MSLRTQLYVPYLFFSFFVLGAFLMLPNSLLGQKKSPIKYPRKGYEAAVKEHLNIPTIHINGHVHAPIQYGLTDVPGGRWTWEELAQHNLVLFGKNGFKMYQLDISFEHMWKENGQMDISLAQKQIRGLLRACPNATVIFRLHVNAPFWWLDKYPDECVAYADTTPVPRMNYGLYSPINDDPRPMERVSLASEKWLKESSEMTALFCKKLSRTKEGRAVIGIQVACGVYGEWHYWGFLNNEPDVGIPMTSYFRQWSKEKYTTTNSLSKAWKDPNVTFSNIQVPNMDERESHFGVFRDPTTERKTIDYFKAQHELTADRIIHFSRLIKDHWPRPIITGTFYGYFFSVFGREVVGGHLALEKILQSPHIDYISAPQCYGPKSRKNGEVYRSRGLVRSCQLNGKLWLDEMDFEPNLHYPFYKHQDIYLSLGRASTRRNMIYSLLKGMGLWFYEFGITGKEDDDFQLKYVPSSGYWDHPDIMSDISAIKTIFDKRIQEKKPYKSNADVLFVFDTESSLYTASLLNKNPLTVLSVDWSTLAAFRSGILFDAIHLSDLQKVNLDQYKTVIFGNCYLLSDDEIAFIKTNVATKGRDIVWLTAPGFTGADGIQLDRIQKITGFSIDTTRLNDTIRVELSPQTHSYFKDADTYSAFSHKKGIWPVFYINDSSAVTFGTFKENNLPAYAMKEFKEHRAWYIAIPAKEEQTNILRYILSESNAHQYINDPKAVVYGGWDLLFYYNAFRKKGEKRKITLKNGKEIIIESPGRGCGILMDATTGEILLEGA